MTNYSMTLVFQAVSEKIFESGSMDDVQTPVGVHTKSSACEAHRSDEPA